MEVEEFFWVVGFFFLGGGNWLLVNACLLYFSAEVCEWKLLLCEILSLVKICSVLEE